ncbi:MAG TPA: PD-(D/E)XK nuclease family protein, partial [Thermoleophilia bacterium]|nr:PD-(D/E)XK nuclease family protein [Thermoleophilia bacterium]
LPDLPAVAPTEEAEEGGMLILPPREPEVRAKRTATPDAAAMIAARGDWNTAREALLAEANRPARATSPSGLEHVDDEVRSGGPGAPAGRAKALALGSAVHAVMELCDLRDEASIEPVAAAVTADLGRPDLADEAAELARACWRSAPVRAAAAALAGDPDTVHRELLIGALVGDAIVSGAVDLLYRDGEEWVVVDYKTDRGADESVLRERYAPQGAAYAVAIEAATGGVVREVVFVAARAGGVAVHIRVDAALRASVAREVDAAVSAGRAIRPDELG